MTECKQEIFEFQAHGSRKVTADFSGGHLSSDGGAVFLRGVDLKMGLIERLAGCFCDYRLPCLVEHKVAELLRQRIGALALGYEDLNDHDELRHDPVLGLLSDTLEPKHDGVETLVHRSGCHSSLRMA